MGESGRRRVNVEGKRVWLTPLLTEGEIQVRVRELATLISKDYEDKDLVVVGVLKGAYVFVADLTRRLAIPCRCDFLSLGSYGAGTKSSGKIEVRGDLRVPVRNRDVLIVEDIVDTGRSLRFAIERVVREDPRTVRVCALLDKPSRREVAVPVNYLGFTVPDHFIVGYGIDWNEHFRELPFIAVVEGA